MVNKAISNLTDAYDLVVTHQDLTERARQKTPSAIHVSVENFMGSPRYDEIVELIDQAERCRRRARSRSRRPPGRTTCSASSRSCSAAPRRARDDAITEAGQLLVAAGAVDPAYVDAMHDA